MQETNKISSSGNAEHFIRPRINSLLAQAVKKPLTIICAGMGCGKTRAVYDFTQQCGIPVIWIQFTRTDNYRLRIWEEFVRAIAKLNKPLADEYKKLGFPDTEDKLNMCFIILSQKRKDLQCIIVFDDVHLIKDAAVLRFMERAVNDASKKRSVILISRELPQINVSSLMVRNNIYIINEAELNFTENELSQFLLEQGLGAEINNLRKIYNDTNGWAFLINFVIRMLKKSPGYMGYVCDAIKNDTFQLIEIEVWSVVSERLKHFLLRLSLTNHYSMELVDILSEKDESLIAELKQQNAFIRFNNHMTSYHIHHLFLEFLYAKKNILSDEEIQTTYKTIAVWCAKNNFIVDALRCYEKINDYESIVSILFESPAQFFMNNAHHIAEIFKRAPEEVFNQVEFSAAMYIHSRFCLGEWQETSELIQYYEEKYLPLPEDGVFKNHMLGCIYYYRAVLRMIQCTVDDCYDFDIYFAKMYNCLINFPIDPGCWHQQFPGLWTSMVGNCRAGAPQEYLDALVRSTQYMQKCAHGLTTGIDDLCRGELLFYQGNIREAELHINQALKNARDYKQFEIVHRSLFYIMRIAVIQGDYTKTETALKEMEKQLECNEYYIRNFTYDIAVGWYYYVLSRPERIPNWLKEKFAAHVHTSTLENFGNQIKVLYCYLTKNHAELLLYMEEQKRRESILFDRVELLAMEACVHYKMNDKNTAFKVLQEAYETAAPNNIIMPFIELGKDMRAVVSAAASSSDCKIPQMWLKNIKQAASNYSRNKASIISDYKVKNELEREIELSSRENEFLHEMYEGLSNSEIAAKYGLSINTVKMHISCIYSKLGARNKADIFRIANELNLL